MKSKLIKIALQLKFTESNRLYTPRMLDIITENEIVCIQKIKLAEYIENHAKIIDGCLTKTKTDFSDYYEPDKILGIKSKQGISYYITHPNDNGLSQYSSCWIIQQVDTRKPWIIESINGCEYLRYITHSLVNETYNFYE